MPRSKIKSALHGFLDDARARHRTDGAAVSETLRVAIVTGVLPPGSPLRQDLLASELGVSRMPIREGIRQLEAEGLVDFVPHRGAAVAPLRAEDVREIAEMRMALECLALERAFTAPSLMRLEEAEHWLVQIDEADLLTARNQMNRRFHAALCGLKPAMRMHRHLEMLYDAYERYLVFEHSQLDRRQRSQEEHRAILSACARGDQPRALAALRAHIEGAGNELIAYLSSHPEFA
jgi:DNA-binding GntR family transcriptional regulator